MLGETMNIFAFAVTLDEEVTPSSSMNAIRNRRLCAVPGSPIAQSAFSLAMIREAFKGLLVSTERSYSSSAEQRGALEPSIEQGRPLDGNSIAFNKEIFSFSSVLASEFKAAEPVLRDYRASNVTPMKFSQLQFNAVSGNSTTGDPR
jgi:hypothetical protein